MNEKREIWADFVKGVTIYLVILGHTIQYIYYGGVNFENNPIFCFIYGFHMPLFACVSGYFLENFIKKYSLTQGILRKAKTILLPCIVWAIGYYIIFVLRFRQFKSLIDFRDDILDANWFLWAIFYCSVISLIIIQFDKSLWKTSIVIIIINLLIPDYYNMTGYKMLYPFILMGVIIKRYHLLQRFLQLTNRVQWLIIAGTLSLYISLYPWINEKYLWEMYVHFDLNRLLMNLERYGINFAGTVSILLLLVKISACVEKKINYYKNPLLITGRKSLGIYLFQSFIFGYLYSKIMVGNHWNSTLQYIYCIVISVVITLFCLICVLITEKSHILSSFLLGQWDNTTCQ